MANQNFYTDVISIHGMEFSGVARTCCTIKQFDGYLLRTYEKILGNQLYVRNEACQEGGSYEDNEINSLLTAVDRQLVPTHTELVVHDLTKWRRTVNSSISTFA